MSEGIGPRTATRDIILLGASAGGVHALSEVVGRLPPNLPASIFVVLHIAPHGQSALPAILSRSGCLPASHPSDGELIQPGRIYVAPPDRHLLIDGDRVLLSRNATENGHRPAVDVLFRTAARVYRRRVIAVVLTGNLDDGTAGLAVVKRYGGVAIVQDPEEADYPSMPASAIASVQVDHVLPLADIGPLLDELVRQPLPPESVSGLQEGDEESNAMREQLEADGSESGSASGFTCPECGGALFEKPGKKPLHFRCRTGHAYSPESLLAKQSETLESALWAALRSLEENAALARRMERRVREGGGDRAGERYSKRAEDAEKHAAFLRSILHQGGSDLDPVADEEPSRAKLMPVNRA
ncbi:MAG TPA: chemotaxis protein CheB [Thermoanaerobaculia bacterium]|nr:chemotaxis protein CheB [Thermoanaerobaculia bacterium]